MKLTINFSTFLVPASRITVIVCAALLQQACAPVLVAGATTGALVGHDRRSTGTIIDDKGIAISAEHAIFTEEGMDGAHVNVTAYNARVLLSGEVPHAATRKRVEEVVRRDVRVRQIHNELAIAAPSSLLSRSSDALITTKVKGTLFEVDQKGFDPSRIKVTTERGIVYLMGIVNRAEADAATDVVRRVGGVLKVVKIFEYQAESADNAAR